ncbi:unnamed protein product [Dicrocoelium dendriticum]|nr:unnamed protein product [Dicrocoelium dendriticum]
MVAYSSIKLQAANQHRRTDLERHPSGLQTESGHETTPPLERFKARIDRCCSINSSARDRLLQSFDPTCPECQLSFKNPTMNNLVLRLHAYRYAAPDWCYTAPLPTWATASPGEDLSATVAAAMDALA